MARARTRRFSGSPGARRRRVWARSSVLLSGITAAAPAITQVLDIYEAAAKLARVEGGTTVGAVKLFVDLGRTAGATLNSGVFCGLQVAGRGSDADDINPADLGLVAEGHQDWMFWAWQGLFQQPATVFYDVKSQRKIQEVGETLWFAVGTPIAADTFSVRVTASTLLLLP